MCLSANMKLCKKCCAVAENLDNYCCFSSQTLLNTPGYRWIKHISVKKERIGFDLCFSKIWFFKMSSYQHRNLLHCRMKILSPNEGWPNNIYLGRIYEQLWPWRALQSRTCWKTQEVTGEEEDRITLTRRSSTVTEGRIHTRPRFDPRLTSQCLTAPHQLEFGAEMTCV